MTGSLKDDVECDNWFLIQLHFEQSTELLTNAIHAHCTVVLGPTIRLDNFNHEENIPRTCRLLGTNYNPWIEVSF